MPTLLTELTNEDKLINHLAERMHVHYREDWAVRIYLRRLSYYLLTTGSLENPVLFHIDKESVGFLPVDKPTPRCIKIEKVGNEVCLSGAVDIVFTVVGLLDESEAIEKLTIADYNAHHRTNI